MPTLEVMLGCICLVKQSRAGRAFLYLGGGPGVAEGYLLKKGSDKVFEFGSGVVILLV